MDTRILLWLLVACSMLHADVYERYAKHDEITENQEINAKTRSQSWFEMAKIIIELDPEQKPEAVSFLEIAVKLDQENAEAASLLKELNKKPRRTPGQWAKDEKVFASVELGMMYDSNAVNEEVNPVNPVSDKSDTAAIGTMMVGKSLELKKPVQLVYVLNMQDYSSENVYDTLVHTVRAGVKYGVSLGANHSWVNVAHDPMLNLFSGDISYSYGLAKDVALNMRASISRKSFANVDLQGLDGDTTSASVGVSCGDTLKYGLSALWQDENIDTVTSSYQSWGVKALLRKGLDYKWLDDVGLTVNARQKDYDQASAGQDLREDEYVSLVVDAKKSFDYGQVSLEYVHIENTSTIDSQEYKKDQIALKWKLSL